MIWDLVFPKDKGKLSENGETMKEILAKNPEARKQLKKSTRNIKKRKTVYGKQT